MQYMDQESQKQIKKNKNSSTHLNNNKNKKNQNQGLNKDANIFNVKQKDLILPQYHEALIQNIMEEYPAVILQHKQLFQIKISKQNHIIFTMNGGQVIFQKLTQKQKQSFLQQMNEIFFLQRNEQ